MHRPSLDNHAVRRFSLVRQVFRQAHASWPLAHCLMVGQACFNKHWPQVLAALEMSYNALTAFNSSAEPGPMFSKPATACYYLLLAASKCKGNLLRRCACPPCPPFSLYALPASGESESSLHRTVIMC